MKTEFKEFNNKSNGDCVIYYNILFKNGKFYVLNNNSKLNNKIYLSRSYYHKIKLNDGFGHFWEPNYMDNENINIDIVEETTTFICEEDVPGHIGHTVFDSIASQFSTLKICGIEMNNNTKIKTLQKLYRYEKKRINFDEEDIKQKPIPQWRTRESALELPDIKNSYKLLFGEEKTYLYKYSKKNKDKLVLFKCLIIGSAHKGIGSFNYDYKSLNGYNGAWKDFRDYCYLRCDIVENNPTTILLNNPNINERPDRQVSESKNIINVLKSNPNHKIIDWKDMKTLKEQIVLLSNTYIYISLDGSSALNSIFLPDNSILINMGLIDNNRVFYRSDFLFPACSYFKVIYLNDFLQNKYIINSSILLNDIINNYEKYYSDNNYSKSALMIMNSLNINYSKEKKLFIFNMLLFGYNDWVHRILTGKLGNTYFTKLIDNRFINDFNIWQKN